MNYKLLTVLALLLPVSAMAQDTQYPARRPGLWVGTVQMGPVFAKSESCVDPSTDRQMTAYGDQKLARLGDKVALDTDGRIVHVTTVAAVGDHVLTTHQTLDFQSDTKITGRGQTMIDAPARQIETADTTSEQHWVGACPANMRPGDIMTNGRVRNINDTLMQ